jgi:secondary thiamine-phosphate synthase enzyme
MFLYTVKYPRLTDPLPVVTGTVKIATQGNTDICDITEQVAAIVKKGTLANGTATVFVPGSTAGITTIEYEPGLVQDLPRLFEQLAPAGKRYAHDDTWHDGNGHAHLRAPLLGPSLTVPFVNKRMTLGTWQQIVLVDFDNKPRQREVVVQIIGE